MTLIERINSFINAVASDIKSLYANKVNKTDVIAVAQGGTGATTATQARKNIGTIEYVASLPAIPEANKFYAVKNGDNVDLYMSDSAGTAFYKFTTSQQTINVLMGDIITQLFANNEQGFAFDFNDLSTMYQDSEGTIPVTGVGQPVGRVLDKSGRGNHASQSTSSKRPILQQNTATGAYYLAFDGVDDYLVTNTINFVNSNDFTLFLPHTKLLDSHEQCLFIIGSDNDRVYESGLAVWVGADNGKESYSSRHSLSGYNILFKTGNPLFNAPVDTVLTLKHDSINKVHGFTLNRRFTKQINIGNSSPLNYKLCIGSKLNNNYPFNGNIYSVIGIARVATPTEITNTENVIAKNVGVTL